MDDLVVWLRAQLDWQEGIALRTIAADDAADRLFAGHCSPRWTLGDVETKRRILHAYEQAWRNVGEHPGDLASEGAMLQMITVLKLLAQPYRDRPDFREEWIR